MERIFICCIRAHLAIPTGIVAEWLVEYKSDARPDPVETRSKKLPQLAELEREAEEELRELVRERLERRCQKVADEQGRISPLKRPQADSVSSEPDDTEDRSRRNLP